MLVPRQHEKKVILNPHIAVDLAACEAAPSKGGVVRIGLLQLLLCDVYFSFSDHVVAFLDSINLEELTQN